MSTIVTLAIEYFAKPHLETRKDQLLERHRTRRAIFGSAEHTKSLVGALLFQARSANANIPESTKEEFSRVRQLLYDEAEKIRNMTMTHNFDMEPNEALLLAAYSGQTISISQAAGLQAEATERIAGLSVLVTGYLEHRPRTKRGRNKKSRPLLERLNVNMQED
jgi:hypothetical protein